MRVPLSWLRDYVNIDLPVEEVAELLTNAGLEVKEIDRIGLAGSALEWDRERLILGRLLKVEQHPDADRLVLATVDYGAAEPKVVVTGAPNLFEYIGVPELETYNLFSPYALEGARLYDGHKSGQQVTTLKGKPLRGIYNDSMLCSEKELGISDDHDGIILMQLNADSPAYAAGTSLQDVLGDAVLEIDIIPNIARCASMVGVARELAALTNQPLRYPDYNVVMEGPVLDENDITIRTSSPELNPRFVALAIDGVRQTPSPYWMQYRLRLAGQRPINVVVDISNYVMLEMGQPNHTFDLDYLRHRAEGYAPNGPIHIHTRLPRSGETLTTLDGTTHKLPPTAILVTDPAGNLSLGGIMGGLDSEIKGATSSVLLEAAAWNFINIRRTASQMGIHTEAAFRFSRGVHPSQAILGAKRAADLLRRLAGGTVRKGIIDTYPLPPEAVVVELKPAYARQLSGLDLSLEEMAELLRRLEFKVEPDGDNLRVTAPDNRLDIDGPHDLVEEICRMYRYDRIPATLLADSLPPQRRNVELEREERVRDLLIALGLQETIGYRLTSSTREGRLLATGTADDRPYVTLTNPPAPDRTVMRHTITSSVLEAAAANLRHTERIALFEIGDIYFASEEGELPDELSHLALVLTGPRASADWQSRESGKYSFVDLKGIIEQLFTGLYLPVKTEPIEHPTYRPGRTARLLVEGQQVGVIGEFHPAVVKGFELRVERDQAVLGAQINLETLLPLVKDRFPYRPLSTYPPILEDLALVVDRHLPAADVEAALRQAGGFLLTQVALFDVYEGDQLPAGKKSLAYHLTFQAPDKTLTDKDVSRQRQRILKQVEQSIGARLRV